MTRSATPTGTFTVTPTWTPSGTATHSPTVTSTHTITPTITVTATVSPTLTPYRIAPDEVVVYPSPGKGPQLWFYFACGETAETELEVFNVAGERLGVWTATVVPDQGRARLGWDIRDVAPGVYLYRLRVRVGSGTKDHGLRRLVIVK